MDDLAACWQCGRPAGALFCESCKALQSPPAEYYALFCLEPKLTLDTGELEKRFYALSRQLHPDLFTRKSERERQHSLEATAALNDAYRTLRDPVTRAEYVLKRNGFDIGEQRSKDVPPELLEEVFELNMALEELREGDAGARRQLVVAQRKFLALRSEIDMQLRALFDRADAGTEQALPDIRAVLNRRRYVSNLVKEVEKGLTAHVDISD